MFKRSETKIKAVFMMQFQATQVPKLKSKGLMLHLVPVDVGKPSVRLEKSPIIEGTCTWENPVYETVKLVKEIKTGRIREKFYYLVVSTGSTKAGFLGEASIDFSDLAEATKPLNLVLPLQTSKSGAILHVTVQRMQEEHDSRSSDDNESPISEACDEHLERQVKDRYKDGNRNVHSHETHSCKAKCNEQIRNLKGGKSENIDAKSRGMVKENSHDKLGMLTNQVKMLERKVEVSEMELQSLREQIIKESKKGQQLSENIIYLKEERDALKAECEQFKLSPRLKGEEEVCTSAQKEPDCGRSSLESIKQELQREKHLNKKLKLKLQKTEDSNSEFVLALRDLNKKIEQKNGEISQLSSKVESIRNAPDALAAVPRKTIYGDEEAKALEDLEKNCGNDDEIAKLKQTIENLHGTLEVHKNEKEEILMNLKSLTVHSENLEKQNQEFRSTLEHNQKENMEMQHNYIESLDKAKQLTFRVETLDKEIKSQALQHSESLNSVDELETQVLNLKREMEDQAQQSGEELRAAIDAKLEQEQRAIRAEEAFRKARRNSADTVERLQEEFRQLSDDLSLKMKENEKLAQISITEANDLRQKNKVLEDMLEKAEEEHQIKQEEYERILHELQEENKGICIKEKEEQEKQLASAKKEGEKLKKEIDQKKAKEENLHLEVKKLRLKNNEVKNYLSHLELEKDNLQKEVAGLQDDLRKKERALAKFTNTRELQGERNCRKNTNSANLKVMDKHSEQNRLGTAQIESLLSEVESLKERNCSAEEALKEMHDRYSEISLRFAEVEGERQQLVMTLRNMKNGKKN